MDFESMGRTLAKNDGIEMQLVGPDGATPLYATPDGKDKWKVTDNPDAPGAMPCLFLVVGQDCRAYRRRKHELVDALRARQKTMKSAQIDTESLKLVAAGVTGWSHIPWEGGLMEFSDDNLLKFLDLYRPSFDQTNEYIADRGNFLRLD